MARTARVAWAVAAAFAALSIALAMVVVFQQNPSVERRLTAVENTVDARLESVEARLESLEVRQREQTDLIAELRARVEELARSLEEGGPRDPDEPGRRRAEPSVGCDHSLRA